MPDLRQDIFDAIDRATDHIVGAEVHTVTDAVMAVVEPRLWRARHTVRGRCRYCGALVDPNHPHVEWILAASVHAMRCQMYVGPLEHRWVGKRINGTFGGLDHECACGGSFRLGGLAGSGDGSETAEPVCPNADQDWRGERSSGGDQPSDTLPN